MSHSEPTTSMSMIAALRSGLDVMMARDDNVIVYGEDVGYFGGVFRVTEGLQAKYGKTRCFDAPISESGIVGTAIGMAAYGLRPAVEIQFADYVYPAYDQIVSELARLRHRSAGDFFAPITIRMPCGGGIYGGQTHSQSPEAVFTHVSGLRTVMPSNPYDAKGLLIAAMECDDPVIFLEPKRLYNGPFDGHHDRPVVPWSKHELGQVPEGYYRVPLTSAAVFRPGQAVTVLTYGTMVWVSECAARETGIDAEIIDLRSLWPLDLDTVIASVKKTGRCVVVHEATRFAGFGGSSPCVVRPRCHAATTPPGCRSRAHHHPAPGQSEEAMLRRGRALQDASPPSRGSAGPRRTPSPRSPASRARTPVRTRGTAADWRTTPRPPRTAALPRRRRTPDERPHAVPRHPATAAPAPGTGP